MLTKSNDQSFCLPKRFRCCVHSNRPLHSRSRIRDKARSAGRRSPQENSWRLTRRIQTVPGNLAGSPSRGLKLRPGRGGISRRRGDPLAGRVSAFIWVHSAARRKCRSTAVAKECAFLGRQYKAAQDPRELRRAANPNQLVFGYDRVRDVTSSGPAVSSVLTTVLR